MKISEVIQEIRKKMKDFDRIECSIPVKHLLKSIRNALDDRESSGTYSLKDLISELKNANGDIDEPVFSMTENAIINDVLNRLGDNGKNISFSYPVERLVEELRYKMDDSKDELLDESSVLEKVREKLPGNGIEDTEFVTDTAILENIRLNLNDSVQPYRWESNRLNEYINSGKNEIRFRRNDVKSGNIGKRFESALIAYATARAFEHEAEDQSDASRCQAYWKTFESELQNAPFTWTDSELSSDISDAVMAIQNRRFTEDVSSRYEQCIISFVLMRAFERARPFGSNEEKYQHYLAKFEADLKSTPQAHNDQEYRDEIEDAIRDIIRRRPDCKNSIYKTSSDILLLNDKFVPAIILHVTGRLSSDGNFEPFHTAILDIPFQWDEKDLIEYMHNGIQKIHDEFMRCEEDISENLIPLNDSFRMMLVSYILARAYEHALSFSDYSEKYKIYRELFESEWAKGKKMYSENEYKRIIFDAIREVTEIPLDESVGNELPIDERYIPAILQYAIYRFALQSGDLTNAGNLFSIYLQLKTSLPKHWSDEELLKFLNSAVREIVRRRMDCKECENTEFSLDGTIPISDKFETPLISYSVVRALEESGKRNVTDQHSYHVKKYEEGLSVIPRHRSDSEFMNVINIACREILRIRPDLRLDANGFPSKSWQNITSSEEEFPFDDSLMPAVVAHTAARCIEEDNGDKNRILFFEDEFKKIVRGDL